MRRRPLKGVEKVEEKWKEGFLRARDEDNSVALDMAVRMSLAFISSPRFGRYREGA